jgi:hypothetical protein
MNGVREEVRDEMRLALSQFGRVRQTVAAVAGGPVEGPAMLEPGTLVHEVLENR